jgi:hypothetical protein
MKKLYSALAMFGIWLSPLLPPLPHHPKSSSSGTKLPMNGPAYLQPTQTGSIKETHPQMGKLVAQVAFSPMW